MKRGFTLIEVMVVTAIVAVLSVVVIANLDRSQKKTRDGQRKADLANLSVSMENFFSEFKYYPEGGALKQTGPDAGVACGPMTPTEEYKDVASNPSCLTVLVKYGFLQKLPKDPSGDNVQYKAYLKSTGYKVIAEAESIGASTGGIPEGTEKFAGGYLDVINGTTVTGCFQVASDEGASTWGNEPAGYCK